MAYSFSGRVRYSEIGENGLLTLPGILNYFQDCSTFQSEEVGLGIDILKEWKRIWVLSAWQVVVDRYPYMGERIKTSTWAYGFRGFMGFRNFTMETEGGERLAYANTFWTYIDAENGLPVRLEAKDTDAYRGKDGKMESKLDMEYAPRKIVLPEDYEQQDSFAVQKHHLDTNHHVNNCQYVQMAMDYLPDTMSAMTPNFAQHAKVADHKANPSYGKYTIMGALLGLIACAGVLIAGYLMDDTIHSSEDMEKYFDLVPLTSIPDSDLFIESESDMKKTRKRRGRR